jgi:predicted DNA binding protein
MVHYEVGFKFRHNCPFNNLSMKYPTAVLAWWNNYDQDVLEVTYSGPDSLGYHESLQNTIGFMGGKVVRKSDAGMTLQLVIAWDGTKYEYSVSKVFMKHGCLVLQPAIHTEGWEWYRLVAFSEKDLKALFRDLDMTCNVEVLSRKTVEEGTVRDKLLITTSDLLGGLTLNQANALAVALDSGYYSVPKRATTEDVAARVGVPRTTYEEHLRKAESKVMSSVAPYVQFSAVKTDAKPKRPSGIQKNSIQLPSGSSR